MDYVVQSKKNIHGWKYGLGYISVVELRTSGKLTDIKIHRLHD